MKGNFHVRFLEEGKRAISSSYSAMTRMNTDTIDWKEIYGSDSPNPRVSAQSAASAFSFDLMNTTSSIQTTTPKTQPILFPTVTTAPPFMNFIPIVFILE